MKKVALLLSLLLLAAAACSQPAVEEIAETPVSAEILPEETAP